MIARCEFDTIYAEPLCYFSLTALDRLFRRHGLLIRDVERLPIHGGTLRIYAARAQGGRESAGPPAPAVEGLLREEAGWGVGREEFYRGFGAKVERLRRELLRLLGEI